MSPKETDANQALDALRNQLQELRQQLGRQSIERLTEASVQQQLGVLREETRQMARAEQEALFELLRQRIDGAFEQARNAQGLGLEQLRAVLDSAREDAQRASSRTMAIEERLTEDHVTHLVRSATESVGAELLSQRFQHQLDALEEAYGRADDRLEDLQSFVESFGPGGLPVLQQRVDEQERLLAQVRSERDDARSQLEQERARVAALEVEKAGRVVSEGIDVERTRQRLQELNELNADLRGREELTDEVDRLRRRCSELERVRDDQSRELATIEQSHVDHQRLAALERERDEADAARLHAERDARHAREREQSRTSALRRLEQTLQERQAEIAAAEDREERLRALDGLSQEQQRQLEHLGAANARLESETMRRAAECDDLREQLRNAELDWLSEQARQQQKWESGRLVQLQEVARREAQDDLRRLQRQGEALQARLDDANHRLEELRKSHQDCADAIADAERIARQEIAARADLESRNAAWREQVYAELQAPAQLAIENAQAQAAQILSRAEAERDQLLAQREALKARLEELRPQVNELEGRVGSLRAEAQTLEQRIQDARPRVVEEEECLASLCEPLFPSPRELAPRVSEDEWMRTLADGVREAGFDFHDRLLRSFHTSLKIADFAPLTVLAGISGTGKSELPRLYADLSGAHFVEIAVQPGWDSPQDLFGFFNYTDGRVKAEPLARLLYQLQNDDDLAGGPVIVLLDEMNLARVEYYFADLLSKLEARRSAHRVGDDDARNRASVQLDIGPGREALPLFVDERVLFVGTMNEDESTLALSDKVIDRASMLTFPAPRKMGLAEQRSNRRAQRRLSWETWRSWHKPLRLGEDHEWLNQINTHMQQVGRPFGHRVFRAIHAYLANYPGHDEQARKQAREDQWAMKILPRLRGLETDDRVVKRGLTDLETRLPESLKAPFNRACDREFFRWEGAPELHETRE